MENHLIDIKETQIAHYDNELLSILLKDRSSGKNIIWATDNYATRGYGYQPHDYILADLITGRHGGVIKPRIVKSKKEQADRIREKGEVFTPSWICNKQNNLIDNAWFGSENVFNVEQDKTWRSTSAPVSFPTADGREWFDYVCVKRLEIACGEAPYLVSRYDTVTGETIDVSQRIGLLDRKLRVVGENTQTEKEWIKWAIDAYKSIYGYDWQGDNVLLARENLLLTFVDYYRARFNGKPAREVLRKIAEILSWNIWQMDGLKYVIPDSCQDDIDSQISLFNEGISHQCPGCANNSPTEHTGIYCKIKDWETGEIIKFVSLLRQESL